MVGHTRSSLTSLTPAGSIDHCSLANVRSANKCGASRCTFLARPLAAFPASAALAKDASLFVSERKELPKIQGVIMRMAMGEAVGTEIK
jgi:hypothetical protein